MQNYIMQNFGIERVSVKSRPDTYGWQMRIFADSGWKNASGKKKLKNVYTTEDGKNNNKNCVFKKA